MKRLFIGLIGSLFFLVAARAQYPGNGIAPTRTPLSQVEQIVLDPLDNEALLQAELQSRAPGRAPHYAKPVGVDITPQAHGHWEELQDGVEVWRLRINSSGARSLNFGFLEYYMPPGGRLLVYEPGQSQVLGPFTPADNETHYQLWTPILAGDEAILEVQLPARQRKALRLRLATVNHDFLGFLEVLSGACNLDVICSASDNWPIVEPYRNAIQSVAVYGLGGGAFCTGFLINTTRNDCTPYFMTANHCEINASNAPSVVVYWNYQNNYCRQPGSTASGGPGNGQLNNFNTGAIYRAGYAPTDFTLIELDDPLANTSQAFFAGWTREAGPPQDTLACVHHPDGSEKRISFSFSDAYPGAWGNGSANVPGGNHLIVPYWNVGATESGSSGAPLFDRQRRVVGQLRGGAASCSNSQYDAFGWFRYSWTGGGTPGTRLKDWLDPGSTNLLFLDGRWLSNCNASISVADSSQEACIPGTAQYTVTVGEDFSGLATLNTYGLPAGISASFSPNPVSPGSTASLNLNIYNTSLSSGIYSFTIRAQDTYSSTEANGFLTLLDQTPPAPTLTAPASGTTGQTLAPVFHWSAHPLAASYDLQVSTDSGFINLICSAPGLPSPDYQGVILEPASTYYFRARGRNTCGAGPWSAPHAFTTAITFCQSAPYDGPPIPISPQGSSYTTSSIKIDGVGTVAGVVIRNIDIGHSYVGDLSAFLRSPSGSVVHLFNRPGVPGSFFGCSGSGLMLGFADDALHTQEELEATCNTYPAISGMFQPIDALSSLIGEPAEGDWKLTVIDHFDQDGGQINGWELELCTTPPEVAQLFPMQDEHLACIEAPYSMRIYVGSGFPGPVNLQVIGAPSGSGSSFNNNPAIPGSFVTLTIDGLSQSGYYPLIITGTSGPYFHFIQQGLEVSSLAPPPALLSPDDESPVFEDYPTFTWTPVAEADTFILQIATDPAFQAIVKTARVATPYYTLDSPLSGNVYFWRVMSANACGINESGKAFIFSLEGTTVGAQAPSAGQEWRVFPNPADGWLHIQWAGAGAAEKTTVELFSIAGKVVRREAFVNNLELSVEGLPAGVYVVVLRNRQGVVVRRVVVG